MSGLNSDISSILISLWVFHGDQEEEFQSGDLNGIVLLLYAL